MTRRYEQYLTPRHGRNFGKPVHIIVGNLPAAVNLHRGKQRFALPPPRIHDTIYIFHMNRYRKEQYIMELKEILSRVDHTLLSQSATWEEIKA